MRRPLDGDARRPKLVRLWGTIPIVALNQDLQTLFSAGTVGGLSGGQLLGRFAARRDEAAFEALIQRHGRMVWASATESSETTTTPKKPSKQRSSCWLGRPL